MIRTLAALCALTTLLFFSGRARAQDSTAPGPFTVSSAEYDLGDNVPLECDPDVVGQPCTTEADCDGTQCSVSCGVSGTCELEMPETEVRAIAYYPTLSQLSPGQALPLIMLVHGRHIWCWNPDSGKTSNFLSFDQWPCIPTEDGDPTVPIPNYRGYDYMASVLASHGYVVVSISLNAINSNLSPSTMIEERAALMEQHLRMWATFNAGAGAVGVEPFDTQLAGHVDLQRIGTMGHSRGGDAVVNHFGNYSATSPFAVRAVMPIAPTNTSNVINGVPLGLLMAYCDGDLRSLPGFKFYDQARYNVPTDQAAKHVFFTRAANHNYFNMAWTPECWDSPGTCPLWDTSLDTKPCFGSTDPDCEATHDDWHVYELGNGLGDDPYCHEGTGPRLTPAEQREVGLAYLAAFFRYYIGNETAFAPLLRGDMAAPIDRSDEVFVAYHPPASLRVDLDRFETAAELDRTTRSGQACTIDADCGAGGHCVGGLCFGDVEPGGGLGASFCTTCYPSEIREAHRGFAGRADVVWSGSGQTYLVQLPPGARDISQFRMLQFRAGVDFDNVSNPSTGVRFTVTLHSGTEQAVASSDSQLGNNDLWKAEDGYSQVSVLNTVRIPYAAFTTTTGFSFANVTDVTFVFDLQAAGSVFLSDLQFTDPPTCNDGVQNQGEGGIDCGGPCPNACPCVATTYQAESPTVIHSTGGPVMDGWNIWSNGYIATNHTFAAGPNSITVTARGQSAFGIAANMVVTVGGAPVGNISVPAATFTPYTFNFTTTAGTKEIRVAFTNDVYAPPNDRNLYIDKIVVNCVSGDSGCTVATAVDLGAPGNDVSVPVNGCVRIQDGYPSWWTTRVMKLENPSSASYPVPFTWTNPCSGSGGSDSFTANWQAKFLNVTNSACATLIDLNGTGTGNITLRYWAN
jgi:hypothetical protein